MWDISVYGITEISIMEIIYEHLLVFDSVFNVIYNLQK